MKILNINSTLDVINGGGTAERTLQMSRYLVREKKIEVSILTIEVGIIDKNNKDISGINLVTLPCVNKRFYVPSPLTISKIAESVRKADVVHLMGHWTIVNLLAYYWIRRYKKPYVVCPAGALPKFGRSRILKVIYNMIGGRSYIQNADVNIAVSRDEYNHFYEYGVHTEKIVLIPNGIEPESYIYKNDQHIRIEFSIGESPYLLYVGRLNLIKGPDLLLKASSKYDS